MHLSDPEENDDLKEEMIGYTASVAEFLTEGIVKVANHLRDEHGLNEQVSCTVISSALAACVRTTMWNMAQAMKVELQEDELHEIQEQLINIINAKLDDWVDRYNSKLN